MLASEKKWFRFEKWWLEKDTFRDVVVKAWNTPCRSVSSIDRWQFKIRTLMRMVRGWAANEIASLNKSKTILMEKFSRLESLSETRELDLDELSELRSVEKELEHI